MIYWGLLIVFTSVQVKSDLRFLKSLTLQHYFGSTYENYVRMWRYSYRNYPEFSDWLIRLRVEKELGLQNFDSTTKYLGELLSKVHNQREIAIILGKYFASFAEGYEYPKLLNVIERVEDIWKRLQPDAYLYYYSKILSRQLSDSSAKLKKLLIARYPESEYAYISIPEVEGLDSLYVGLVYFHRGRYKDALRLIPPTRYPKEYLLSLYYLGKWEEFIHSLKNLKYLLPPSDIENLKFKKAIALERLGQYKEAINELVDLVKINKDWLERTAYELSNLAVEKGWINKIVNILKSLPVKGPQVYSRLGLIYLAIADTSDALYWFKKNLNSQGKFYRPQAFYYLYKLTGDTAYLDSLVSGYPLSYYLWLSGLTPKGFREYRIIIDTSEVSDRFKLFTYLHDNILAMDELSGDKFNYSYAFYAKTIGNPYLSIYIAGRVLQRTDKIDSMLMSMLFPYPERWQPLEKLGVPIPLVLGLIREESTFRHNAVSPAGAIGFMQLIPRTYLYVSGSKDYTGVFRPSENLKTGVRYLEELLTEFGDTVLAIAAYNAGPSRVKKWWDRWNKAVVNRSTSLFVEFIPYRETRTYVRRVLRSMRVYEMLYRGKQEGCSIENRFMD